MKNTVKVRVTVGDRRITFEGPPDFVRAEVQRLTNPIPAAGPIEDGGLSTASAIGFSSTERELISEKKPHGHAETVAVLAYWLTKSGTTQFTRKDMRGAYIRACARQPRFIDQALRDARNKHEFLEAGTARGTFRLSAHGERVVLRDLPRKKSPSPNQDGG